MLQNEMKTSSERLEELSLRIEHSEMFDIEGAKFDISEHVFSMMELRGVSKAKLARSLGKSRSYVTKILQGNANFTLESLVKIARALDCKLDVRRVLVPVHHEPVFGWEWAQNPKVNRSLGAQRAEREYIRLVKPLNPEKENKNARLATAA